MFGFGRWRHQIRINAEQIACNKLMAEAGQNLLKTNELLMERVGQLERRVDALEATTVRRVGSTLERTA